MYEKHRDQFSLDCLELDFIKKLDLRTQKQGKVNIETKS